MKLLDSSRDCHVALTELSLVTFQMSWGVCWVCVHLYKYYEAGIGHPYSQTKRKKKVVFILDNKIRLT